MSNKISENPTTCNVPPQSSAEANVLLLRQPICATDSLRTRGYEIFLESAGLGPHGIGVEASPLATLIDVLVDIGIETIAGDQPAFITVRPDQALDDFVSLIPTESVVLQVDVSSELTAKTVQRMERLRSDGYRFALKNFRYRPSLDSLLPLAHYVKLNVKTLGPEAILRERELLGKYALQFLAVGADSAEEVDLVMKGHFDLIQGYFFCKPKAYQHKSPMGNRLGIFKLLAKLRDPGIGPRELETIIAEDLSLSYRLLRFVNSAMNGLSRRVDSVRHAATMVGTERIRSWATLIAFSRIDDKPQELLRVSLLRAKLAECIAEELSLSNRDAYFTVGLFSSIDAFLDCPMAEALERLPLSREVTAALLSHSGRMGQVLESIKEYEQSNWFPLIKCLRSPNAVQRAYLHALDWVRQSMGEISH